jgi:hypothetical protein
MNPNEIKTRDADVVERALPAHMLVLMAEQCMKAGYEFRSDVLHRLNMAAAAPLAKCDQLSIARLAKRIDDCAVTLLRDLSPDDPRHGLYSCAMFALSLVSEGRIEDKQNQAVLVSLLLIDDLKDESKDTAGNGAVWKFEEQRLVLEAKKLIGKSVLMGLYPVKEMQLIAL